MQKILFIFGIIFVIGVTPLITSSYSEYLSPRKQMELGVLPEDVTCREGKVLVIRDNGNPACVTERVAEKIGWEIISTVKQNEVGPEDESVPTEKSSIPPSQQEENDFAEYQKQMEKIDGLIFPVEDKDEFANKIFEYLGDEIIEKEDKDPTNYRDIFDSERTTYYGENTIVSVSSTGVGVTIYRTTINDPDEIKKFVDDIMNLFGMDKSKGVLTYDLIASDRASISYSQHNVDGAKHDRLHLGDYGEIRFKFKNYKQYSDAPKYSTMEQTISFGTSGWINNPEDVPFAFPTPIAVFAVRDIIQNSELGIPEEEGGTCDFQFDDGRMKSKKMLLNKIPYYKISYLGGCTIDFLDRISYEGTIYEIKHYRHLLLTNTALVNGWNVTDISLDLPYEFREIPSYDVPVTIEYPSVQQQRDDGVAIEDLVCKRGLILAQRDDRISCLTSSDIERQRMTILNDFKN